MSETSFHDVQALIQVVLEIELDNVDAILGTQLEIDNSDLEPEVVAEQIVTHFGLEITGKLRA